MNWRFCIGRRLTLATGSRSLCACSMCRPLGLTLLQSRERARHRTGEGLAQRGAANRLAALRRKTLSIISASRLHGARLINSFARWRPLRPMSCFWARRVQAKRLWRAPCIACPDARVRSLQSIAGRFPVTSSQLSCLVTRRARLRELKKAVRSERLKRPKAERYFWTRLAKCPSICRWACCASFRNKASRALGRPSRISLTCVFWLLRIKMFEALSMSAVSVPICTIA